MTKKTAPPELVDAYWASAVVDGKLIWTHPNATKLFAEHGLVLKDCEIASAQYGVKCSRCKESFEAPVASRSAVVTIRQRIRWGNWREQEEAREAAREHREGRRGEMSLKHGELFTGNECPDCDTGWLVIRLASDKMVPFAACSSWNPYKSVSCRYTCSIAPESHGKYLQIFSQRLAVKAKSAQASQADFGKQEMCNA